MNAIEIVGLTKTFGSRTAVDALNLSVLRGETFALLGQNGAGKTTTLRMLSGLLPPSGGAARIMGHDVGEESLAANLNINLFDNPATVEIDGKTTENTFGGLYSNTDQTFVFTTSGQIEQVQLNNFMPSFDVGTNPNELQIFIPGEYEINYMIRIAPVETPDQTISAGVRQNGSFIDSTLQYSTLSTTDVTVLQGSVIEFLSGTVDLAFLSTDTAALNLTPLTNATLTVERVSPFR